MASSLPSGPVFISAHSADVILSDIRPVKLAQDALASLNAVLDEILTSVILTARSLSTDRLKASLLRILTTSLGKEALLEAELELRAYWERTKATPPSAGDTDRLNVHWAVELLRLKCVAYSTMNDTDEDAQAERKLADRMGNGDLGCSPALVAPAALYMTAILECLCEHILSNVGRVATRDSSRTVASVTDLFTALCEDDAMYALFKSLHIYDQISMLSKAPKHRHNKSISGQKPNEWIDPMAPQEQLLPPSRKDSHHRKSSESASGPSAFTPGHSPSGVSRSSLDKVRGIKLFNKAHGRTASDRDVQSGADVYSTPRKSESGGYDHAGAAGMQTQSLSGHSDANHSAASVEDERDQEFEDLVRSAGTMKMSLTPDRLRTMEPHRARSAGATGNGVGNGTQRAADIGATPTRVNAPPASPAPPTVQRSTSLRHKLSQHSFKDSDGSRNPSAQSVLPSPSATRRKNPTPPAVNGNPRSRSISTSGAYPSKGGPPPALPQASVVSSSTAPSHLRSLTGQPSRSNAMDEFGMPKKTRRIQRNPESMDLDDIMNGSDDEVGEMPKTPSRSVRSPSSAKTGGNGPGGHVSQSARDLIAFLEDGPPVDPYSRPPVDLPPIDTVASPKSSKGRLQRMISKLSLSAERESQQSPQRANASGFTSLPPTPSARYTPPLPVPVVPKPPRYNPPPASLISPPDSPTDGAEAAASGADRPRKASTRKAVPAWNPSVTNLNSTPLSTVPSSQQTSRQPSPSNTPNGTLGASTPPTAGSWVQPTPLKVVNGQLERLPAHKVERRTDAMPSTNIASSVSPASPVSPPPRPERAERIASPPDVILQSAPRKSTSARGGRPDSANSEKRARRQQTIPPPEPSPLPAPTTSEALAVDMRRMLAKATSADECRLLVDMFMARSGYGMSPADAASIAATAPPIDPERVAQTVAPPALERELVELFLGEGSRVQPVIPDSRGLTADARAYQTPRHSRETASPVT
ncbi:hypothetical protein PENSPDRAFT_655546 [Peniophora sp. CONT]|nr:hypothetical protein PENSPDRAFT_655546 [Peniophora sp. CONT]